MVQLRGAAMPYKDETELVKIYEHADPYYRTHNRTPPRYMEGETSASYRKRLATGLQQHTPTMKDINLRESVGTAFNLIEKQIYDEARREAERPSNIPAGEMRELRKFDATGRPFYEFHGHPSAWLDDFSHGTKKRVVGIKQDPNARYTLNR
jgi:hypothetical protein